MYVHVLEQTFASWLFPYFFICCDLCTFEIQIVLVYNDSYSYIRSYICINVHAKSSLLICSYVFTYMQQNFITKIIVTAANRDAHIML